MGTDHHRAFDRWWEHVINHYVTWEAGRPVAMDLYYDPIVDEHVSSPMGLIAPVWYLAPQRREVAESAWRMAATLTGLLGDGEPSGLKDPNLASLLAWHTGEFVEGEVKARLWVHLDEVLEPSWGHDLGEFTFGFGLDEPHPRGQLNARAMAGWVCTPGAWSRIFNESGQERFLQPTVAGVDFPRVAMSEARWDGTALRLAAHPQNSSVAGTRTSVRITGLPPDEGWTLTRPDGSTTAINLWVDTTATDLELVVDGGGYELRRG